MNSHYQYWHSSQIHHFRLKHPDARAVDAWLEDMTQLVTHYNQLPEGDEPVLIMIEYDGTGSTLPMRYIIDRSIDWMQRTPRRRTARVCVLTTETVIVAVLDRIMSVFSGRDKIRIMRFHQTEEAQRWLLSHAITQPSIQSSK
jgi:hypothetical protein